MSQTSPLNDARPDVLAATPEHAASTVLTPFTSLMPTPQGARVRPGPWEAGPVLPRPGQAPRSGRLEDEGFRVGWEHARYRCTPPADHLHAGHPVRQGWEAGRAAFAGRTLPATRAARLWLALRLQAWMHGQRFDDLLVTPRLVARIDVDRCPVTQIPLTDSPSGAQAPTDAVVMPLHEQAGCVAGHLAVVSRQVAQARAALSAEDIARQVQRLCVGEESQVSGLDLQAWRRLQALTSLVTTMDHPLAAAQALHVLPPPRVHLVNPVQGLQAVLTLVFTGPGYARRLTELGAWMPGDRARRAYFLFMSAMLARRMSARGAVPPSQVRSAMERAWSHPGVLQRWRDLAGLITPAQAERLLRRLAQQAAGDRRGARAGSPAGAAPSPGPAKAVAWRWVDAGVAADHLPPGAREEGGRGLPSRRGACTRARQISRVPTLREARGRRAGGGASGA